VAYSERNGGNQYREGYNILLKVMADDMFNIRVASGWSSTSPTNSQANVYPDLFSSVTNGLAAHSAGKVTLTALQSLAAGIGPAFTAFLNSQPAANNTPKAFLAWLLFDELFQLVNTGAQQVGASGATTLHVVNGQLVTKSGYLYVYTSNEATNMDVFFDNLQVTHIQGALLEETHYYPFGLIMVGISSKAAEEIENKRKLDKGCACRIKISAMAAVSNTKQHCLEILTHLAPLSRYSGSRVSIRSTRLCPEKVRVCFCRGDEDDPSQTKCLTYPMHRSGGHSPQKLGGTSGPPTRRNTCAKGRNACDEAYG
jgi:hypothetical protein